MEFCEDDVSGIYHTSQYQHPWLLEIDNGMTHKMQLDKYYVIDMKDTGLRNRHAL